MNDHKNNTLPGWGRYKNKNNENNRTQDKPYFRST